MPPKGPFADQVTTPDQLGYLNLLVFGMYGAGKTRLAGTAQDHPMTSPVLILDIEGGTTTLRDRKDIDVMQIRKPDDIVDIHNTLYQENNGHYKTVVLDSLSELQDVDMMDIMRKMIQKRPDRDPDIPDQREWGQNRNHLRKIVRAFRDLPMNTIFTTLVTIDKDNTTGVVTYHPALPGKLRIEIPGFLDVVGYLYTQHDEEGVKRTIQFAQTKKIMAKDRTNAFGDLMDNPTIPAMWNLLHPDAKEKGK